MSWPQEDLVYHLFYFQIPIGNSNLKNSSPLSAYLVLFFLLLFPSGNSNLKTKQAPSQAGPRYLKNRYRYRFFRYRNRWCCPLVVLLVYCPERIIGLTKAGRAISWAIVNVQALLPRKCRKGSVQVCRNIARSFWSPGCAGIEGWDGIKVRNLIYKA